MNKKRPSESKPLGSQNVVNCFACRHFYITYDPQFPYGCREAGFKSRVIPSREMATHSGLECQLFTEKQKP